MKRRASERALAARLKRRDQWGARRNLTIAELSDWSGVSPYEIRKAMKAGTLRTVSVNDNGHTRQRIPLDAAKAFCEEHLFL